MFLYSPLDYIRKNETNVSLKIFYFSLEMSKEQKLRQAICNRLYMETKGDIRIDAKELRSSRKAIEKDILDKVESYDDYFKEFDKSVTFIDDIKNPTGIKKFMEEYAQKSGKIHKRIKNFTNNKTKEVIEKEIFDYYEPNDPEEYVIIIVDHAALLHQETFEGKRLSLHQTISLLSSRYFVELRNKYNYIPVLIQQQASSQESLEHLKANRVKPSLEGLGDNKMTQRDANVVLGLLSPFRHRIKKYPEKEGYNIEFFKDNIRFLEVLASREGGGDTLCPLYFDGAVNYFKELPLPDKEQELSKVEQFLKKSRIKWKSRE